MQRRTAQDIGSAHALIHDLPRRRSRKARRWRVRALPGLIGHPTRRMQPCQAELAGAPRMGRGSQGQSLANPLLVELRQLHLAINQTLARIKADVPEASV